MLVNDLIESVADSRVSAEEAKAILEADPLLASAVHDFSPWGKWAAPEYLKAYWDVLLPIAAPIHRAANAKIWAELARQEERLPRSTGSTGQDWFDER